MREADIVTVIDRRAAKSTDARPRLEMPGMWPKSGLRRVTLANKTRRDCAARRWITRRQASINTEVGSATLGLRLDGHSSLCVAGSRSVSSAE